MEVFLDKLIRLNSQSDGRDKIARFSIIVKFVESFIIQFYRFQFQTFTVCLPITVG